MTKPNRSNCDIALSLIASGQWRVDAESGLVYGKRGNPFARTNTDGYIQIKYRDPDDWRKSRTVLAHRLIWESHHGPLADALEINHIDGVKTNNSLTNLEAISHLANMRHAVDTGLAQAMRGMDQGRAILSDEDALAIYERAWANEDQSQVARDFGVTRASVSNIKQGWSWTHVTGHVRPVA